MPNDITEILTERGNNYGKFVDHADVTQTLKEVITLHTVKHGKILAADQREAIEMICHKLGRIVNGNPDYADSWIDIAGYATLVSDRLQGIVR